MSVFDGLSRRQSGLQLDANKDSLFTILIILYLDRCSLMLPDEKIPHSSMSLQKDDSNDPKRLFPAFPFASKTLHPVNSTQQVSLYPPKK